MPTSRGSSDIAVPLQTTKKGTWASTHSCPKAIVGLPAKATTGRTVPHHPALTTRRVFARHPIHSYTTLRTSTSVVPVRMTTARALSPGAPTQLLPKATVRTPAWEALWRAKRLPVTTRHHLSPRRHRHHLTRIQVLHSAVRTRGTCRSTPPALEVEQPLQMVCAILAPAMRKGAEVALQEQAAGWKMLTASTAISCVPYP